MRLLVSALAVLLALSPPALAQALPHHVDPGAREIVPNLTAVPTIRFLTTADFPPFNFRDDKGELVGFNIDLARALCNDLSIACTVQAWPWDQAARALEDKQGDALIAGLAITPENGALFDFSNVYLMLPGRFVTPVAAAGEFDPASLAGRRVAVRRASTHAEFVRRYLAGATLVDFDTEIAALDALQHGQVDAFFGDGLRAAFWLNSHVGCCDFAGEPYFRPDLFGEGFAIALPAGHDAVRQAIDYGLGRLKRSGVFDELYLRWFPVSFY
ncbi:transporter substrate-binding domain-containing protein [Devosia sp.]|uniref:transporter substrate-binding domain-containing protein n=1 Tax=Devosia sp. TaxID=1871048 RepID=UPI0035AE27C2